MHAVPANRSAECRADLLIGVRQDAIDDRVFCIQVGVPEETGKRARVRVSTSLRHGVYLYPDRPALCRVEPAADELELPDGIAAELWLAPARARHHVADLLAVEIQLKVAGMRLGAVGKHDR